MIGKLSSFKQRALARIEADARYQAQMSRAEFHAVIAVRMHREAQPVAEAFLAQAEIVNGAVRHRKANDDGMMLYEFSDESDAVLLVMAVGGMLTTPKRKKYI